MRVDPEGSPVVGRRQGAEAVWTTVNLGALADNPFQAPTVADPHNVYAVGVDGAGYVHIAGNMHNDPLRYARSQEPFGIDSWVQPTMIGTDETAVSYPAFARSPRGPVLALPVTHRTADVVAPTTNGSPVLVNQGGLAVDEDGRPHAVFRVLDRTASRSDAVHVWMDADGWRTEPVATITAMSGRPALVGGGAGPLLLIWPEQRGADRTEVRVAHLSGRRTTDNVALASCRSHNGSPPSTAPGCNGVSCGC